MNIRRYITALLLLFGCIISMSAVAVPNVRSVVRQDGAVVESTEYYPMEPHSPQQRLYSLINMGLKSLIECTASTSTIAKRDGMTRFC